MSKINVCPNSNTQLIKNGDLIETFKDEFGLVKSCDENGLSFWFYCRKEHGKKCFYINTNSSRFNIEANILGDFQRGFISYLFASFHLKKMFGEESADIEIKTLDKYIPLKEQKINDMSCIYLYSFVKNESLSSVFLYDEGFFVINEN